MLLAVVTAVAVAIDDAIECLHGIVGVVEGAADLLIQMVDLHDAALLLKRVPVAIVGADEGHQSFSISIR